jgi:hypothetical protein
MLDPMASAANSNTSSYSNSSASSHYNYTGPWRFEKVMTTYSSGQPVIESSAPSYDAPQAVAHTPMPDFDPGATLYSQAAL